MNQNAFGQVTNGASVTEGEAQEATLQQGNEVTPMNSDASDVIAQCLLIAARRGRQIRLARATRLELQQSESGPVSEEMSRSNET